MARIYLDGFENLAKDIQNAFLYNKDLQTQALKEMSGILEKEAKKQATDKNVIDTQQMRDSITYKMGSNAKGVYALVYPKGERKEGRGRRNAEIAFLNEYGVPSRDIPARPFMADAIDTSEPELLKTLENAVDKHLKKYNF